MSLSELKEVYQVVEHISAYSVLLPVLLSIIKIKALNRSLWALFLYFVLCIIADRMSLALLPDQGKANSVLNLFTILECSIFSLIFYWEFKKFSEKIFAGLMYLSFIIFALYSFRTDFNGSDNKVNTYEASIIIIMSSIFFIKFLRDQNSQILIQFYFFWINSSLLIYFCGVLLLFLNSDFLTRCNPKEAIFLWSINDFSVILSNILFSVGIWKIKKI